METIKNINNCKSSFTDTERNCKPTAKEGRAA